MMALSGLEEGSQMLISQEFLNLYKRLRTKNWLS